MNSNNLKRLSVFAAAGISYFAFGQIAALASPTVNPVASFTEQSSVLSPVFTYTNNGASSTVSASNLAVNVLFDSATPNTAPANTSVAGIAAILDLTGTLSAPAQTLAPDLYSETLSSLSLNFYDQATSKLLLTESATANSLGSPILYVEGPVLGIDADLGTATVSSPYVTKPLIDADFSVAGSNLPTVTVEGNGYLSTYTADITGSSAAAVVPETSTGWAFGISTAGLLGLGVLSRRKAVLAAKI